MKFSCCFGCNGCNDEEDGPIDDSGERTHLLRDPVSNNLPSERVQRSESKNLGNHSDDTSTREGGQEDELTRIVQETASAMIDVSGSTSHSLDQRECQERSRHYLQKIQTLTPAITPVKLLLIDTPNPERNLNSKVSKEDLDLMNWAVSEVEEALSQIKVDFTEDLVVPFGNQEIVSSSS